MPVTVTLASSLKIRGLKLFIYWHNWYQKEIQPQTLFSAVLKTCTYQLHVWPSSKWRSQSTCTRMQLGLQSSKLLIWEEADRTESDFKATYQLISAVGATVLWPEFRLCCLTLHWSRGEEGKCSHIWALISAGEQKEAAKCNILVIRVSPWCCWCSPGKARLLPGGFLSRESPLGDNQSSSGGQKIHILIWTEAWS